MLITGRNRKAMGNNSNDRNTLHHNNTTKPSTTRSRSPTSETTSTAAVATSATPYYQAQPTRPTQDIPIESSRVVLGSLNHHNNTRTVIISLDSQTPVADRLLAEGEYLKAIKQYQRYIKQLIANNNSTTTSNNSNTFKTSQSQQENHNNNHKIIMPTSVADPELLSSTYLNSLSFAQLYWLSLSYRRIADAHRGLSDWCSSIPSLKQALSLMTNSILTSSTRDAVLLLKQELYHLLADTYLQLSGSPPCNTNNDIDGLSSSLTYCSCQWFYAILAEHWGSLSVTYAISRLKQKLSAEEETNWKEALIAARINLGLICMRHMELTALEQDRREQSNNKPNKKETNDNDKDIIFPINNEDNDSDVIPIDDYPKQCVYDVECSCSEMSTLLRHECDTLGINVTDMDITLMSSSQLSTRHTLYFDQSEHHFLADLPTARTFAAFNSQHLLYNHLSTLFLANDNQQEAFRYLTLAADVFDASRAVEKSTELEWKGKERDRDEIETMSKGLTLIIDLLNNQHHQNNNTDGDNHNNNEDNTINVKELMTYGATWARRLSTLARNVQLEGEERSRAIQIHNEVLEVIRSSRNRGGTKRSTDQPHQSVVNNIQNNHKKRKTIIDDEDG